MGCSSSSDIKEGTILHPDKINGSCYQCSICFKNIERKKLFLFCNKKPCSFWICGDCVSSLAKVIKKGKINPSSVFLCPACKSVGNYTILAAHCGVYYNEALLFLSEYRMSSTIPEKIGICRCSNIGIPGFIGSERCGIMQSELEDYMCNDCTIKERLTKECIKKCPGCYHQTFKDGGCFHVTCVNPMCYHQFCWECMRPWLLSGCHFYHCKNTDRRHSNHNSNCSVCREQITLQHQQRLILPYRHREYRVSYPSYHTTEDTLTIDSM